MTTKTLSISMLLASMLLLMGTNQALAWDSTPDDNGLYDGLYDRPTYFPDWEQPSTWPNAMYYLCDVRLADATGPQLTSYEIAVYDQNDVLRHCSRSIPKDDNRCVLTIRGVEGDKFHFKVVYGDDFMNPVIVDIPEKTVPFLTNDLVGTPDDPFLLIIPSRTVLDEKSTALPVSKQDVDVTVLRTIKGGEWSTICLPFAIPADKMETTFGAGVELADFMGCETTYETDGETVKSINVKFSSVTAIEANHPYIIKVRENLTQLDVDHVDIIALGQDVEAAVECDEYTEKIKNKTYYFYNRFVGNYANGFTVPNQTLFLCGGKFWYSVGQTHMMAFRAYFDFYDMLPEPSFNDANSRIMIVIDDVPTDINSVNQIIKCDHRYYDLQGRMTTNPSKGLFICSGRKYLIK